MALRGKGASLWCHFLYPPLHTCGTCSKICCMTRTCGALQNSMIQWKGDAGLQLETADRWKVYGRRLTLIDIVTNVPLFTPSDWNHSWQKWSKHAQAIQNHWNESKPKPYSKSQITTKQCNAKVTQRKTHSTPIHTNRCQPFTCFLKRWVHPSISQSSNFTMFTTLC